MELKKYRLGEIVDFNKETISRQDNLLEIKYLDTSNILDNVIYETPSMKLSEAPSRAQRKVKHLTIIYSTVRPRLKHHGILQMPPENLIVSTGFATLDIKDSYENMIDATYLYLLLTQSSVTEYLGNIADTAVSAYPSINPSDISSLSFIFPDITIQRKIASIWTSYDQKIHLNSVINDNLEAMAKQLYDYWFVQFDFPNEDGKPYKSSGGAMMWNEKLKREIPQGWSVLSVNDIAASVRGVSYAKDDMVDSNNGVLVLRGNNIQDNHLIYDSNVAYIPSSFVSENQHIRPLDIIMTMSSGSKEHIGKSAMFQFASEDTFGAFLTKFTAKEHCAYLLFNLFNSKYFKAKIKSIACGTGINNLTNQTFDEIYVVMPEDELLLEFDKRQSQIFAEIGLIEKSNIELTKQRDELLPLLMNGQASVNSD